jgi:hypothetical protein
MPFYIKQYPSAVIWRVHVVEAESREAARVAPCTEENYLGYFKGDSPSPVWKRRFPAPSRAGKRPWNHRLGGWRTYD